MENKGQKIQVPLKKVKWVWLSDDFQQASLIGGRDW